MDKNKKEQLIDSYKSHDSLKKKAYFRKNKKDSRNVLLYLNLFSSSMQNRLLKRKICCYTHQKESVSKVGSQSMTSKMNLTK